MKTAGAMIARYEARLRRCDRPARLARVEQSARRRATSAPLAVRWRAYLYLWPGRYALRTVRSTGACLTLVPPARPPRRSQCGPLGGGSGNRRLATECFKSAQVPQPRHSGPRAPGLLPDVQIRSRARAEEFGTLEAAPMRTMRHLLAFAVVPRPQKPRNSRSLFTVFALFSMLSLRLGGAHLIWYQVLVYSGTWHSQEHLDLARGPFQPLRGRTSGPRTLRLCERRRAGGIAPPRRTRNAARSPTRCPDYR
jgi:hypothetical protein